ncbi:type II secretion system protein GspM [Pollutimonas harenae]|uniref:Type II secretion system protein M n=1 Tax=Pollutimonas harenae TaxID=657015 RepID=A0A853GV44_9BURK|nr:type II secretion system protein GspM [Pollutimonas harenae]NYT86007.1 type II secretion system protein M [Pollutimonas harenae]TEA71055.1 type II secretion system protein M [Pollutimonas harenae]
MNRYSYTSNTSQASAWRQQIDTLSQQIRSWWNTRSRQERKLLRLCSIVIVVALVWVLGLQPALKSIEQSRAQLPVLHADAAQVQAYILEAQALQRRHTGKINAADLTPALHTSLQRAGLQEALTINEIHDSGDISMQQWEITVFNASAARTMAWLAELPYLLRLHISTVELERANIQGRDRPGHVSGHILVQRAVKGQP